MTLRTLYTDELRGMARSRVMLALWIGLPVLTGILKLLQPDTEGVPLLTFVAVIIGSIGGTLSAVLLSTTVTSERNRHVYDLFLVRPVRRGHLLLAKYLAACTALLVAAALSMILALIVDAAGGSLLPGTGELLLQSLVVSIAGMMIASAVGVLIGVLINSVAVSAIVSVYLGNQLSALIVLPAVFLPALNIWLFAPLVGVTVPVLVMLIAVLLFRRKSL